MANTIQLKRRIKTAQNVSKTTRAMQMIAASKMKRAQEATLASRPYVEKITFIGRSLRQRLDEESLHEYMKETIDTKKTLYILLSPDKGLCGGLITNLLREYSHAFSDENIYVVTVGKKLEHHVAKSKNHLLASFPFGTSLPRFDMVYSIVEIINEYFLGKKVDSVKILSSTFVSIFTQKPQVIPILPLTISKEEVYDNTSFQVFEPDVNEMLPLLLKRYLEMIVYQYLLESYVSEQAARMISMQNATNNANDIIEDLTLEYNKARQTKITNEILDIAGGSVMKYA